VQRKVFRAGSLPRTLIRFLSSFNQLSIRNYKNRGWHLKKKISKKISSKYIDSYYNKALKAGAIGGKLLGAGEGAFLLIYCPLEKTR
jgi:galactokinase/mevalonate kinase-like predicted kinase